MKEDDAIVSGGSHKLVLYVEKDDASYGPLQTGSFMTEKYLDDFLEKKEHLREKLLNQLENGLISPVSCYMTLLDIAEADLAARAGVSCRNLRKHLTPDGFAKLSLRQILKYADVFGIPVADMFQIILPGDKKIQIRREKTKQPMVVITRISEGEK